MDDGEQEVEDVAWLPLFARPEVGDIFDAALLVGRDGITLHNPLDGILAIDLILVGFFGDTFYRDASIVEDRRVLGLLGERRLTASKFSYL